MKKRLIVLFIAFASLLCCLPVSAACSEEQLADGCVSTAIIGNGCSCNNDESGIINILKLIIDIVTIPIALVGVIGITIVGIQYLTAGGDTAKVTKAKRRMLEIIIGIATYAVLYVFLGWLLPEFTTNPTPSTTNNTSTTNNNSSTSTKDNTASSPNSTNTPTDKNNSTNSNNTSNSNNSTSSNNSSNSTGSNNSSSSSNSNNSNNSSSSSNTPKTGFVNQGNKVYYYDKNGNKVTGSKKINGAEYYFNQNGVMQTGFVTIDGKNYYYKETGKDKGKKAFGTIQVKGKYNGTSKKDTWYLNSRTGAVEGVRLAVPRIAQTGYNCGPTSLLMIRAYHVGAKPFTYEGQSYAWNREAIWAEKCGSRGYGFATCSAEFGYKAIGVSPHNKERLLNDLFNGLPFIVGIPINDFVIQQGFTGGGGHYLVANGYYNNTFYYTDPAGGSTPRKTQSSWEILDRAAAGYTFFHPK